MEVFPNSMPSGVLDAVCAVTVSVQVFSKQGNVPNLIIAVSLSF
jgi:hypothetical protein